MITLYEYKAERCLWNGTLSNDGIYMKFTMHYTSNKSTASYVIKIKEVDTLNEVQYAQGYSTNYNSSYVNDSVTIEQGKAYFVTVTLTDSDGTITEKSFIPKTFVLIDFNSSGQALAIGKISEKTAGIEFGMDIFDEYNTRIMNGLAYYQSNIDADTCIEEMFLTTLSGIGMCFVRQLFFQGKSATTNRTQIAFPYAYNSSGMVGHKKSNYRRNYVSGIGWSDWVEEPVIIESNSSGIWTWKKYSDGTAECLGRINVSGSPVTAALGGWFRSEVLYGETDYQYPVTFIEAPVTEMMFQSRNGSGALVWAFSADINKIIPYLPQCYLIRPTTASFMAGNINILAKGKFQ